MDPTTSLGGASLASLAASNLDSGAASALPTLKKALGITAQQGEDLVNLINSAGGVGNNINTVA
jgi:hypothetical protein